MKKVKANRLKQLVLPEMEKRGWSQNRLAKEIGISGAALSTLLRNTEIEPSLATVTGIANVLEVPMSKVAEACGYSVVENDTIDEDEKIRKILRVFPELKSLLDTLIYLTEDDRETILQIAFVKAERRRMQSQHRRNEQE
jgi:transcriptional regulator with XRE-family HTH domain